MNATAPAEGLDTTLARLVAAEYLDAPRETSDPMVVAAYRELARQAGRLYERVTSDREPRSVHVVFTRAAEPYADARELCESVRVAGVLEVVPACSDHDRRHPLLDTSPGGEYDRFRTVHDVVSHGWLGHGFDRAGEYAAWRAEDRLYRGLARWALATELHAEHSVWWTSGDPATHKAVLLRTTRARLPARGTAEASADRRARLYSRDGGTVRECESWCRRRDDRHRGDGPRVVPAIPGRWRRRRRPDLGVLDPRG